MAMSNESNSDDLVKPPFRKGLAVATGFPAKRAGRPATNISTLMSIDWQIGPAAISPSSMNGS